MTTAQYEKKHCVLESVSHPATIASTLQKQIHPSTTEADAVAQETLMSQLDGVETDKVRIIDYGEDGSVADFASGSQTTTASCSTTTLKRTVPSAGTVC